MSHFVTLSALRDGVGNFGPFLLQQKRFNILSTYTINWKNWEKIFLIEQCALGRGFTVVIKVFSGKSG